MDDRGIRLHGKRVGYTEPVALINERLSEGLEPNDFHFMRYVQCPDAGVGCLGYGKVTAQVHVVPRVKG